MPNPAPFQSRTAQRAAEVAQKALARMEQSLTDGVEDVAPYLKVAARNAGIAASLAKQIAEDHPHAEQLLDQVIEAAEIADAYAVERQANVLTYLAIITTCLSWLAKLESAAHRDQRTAERAHAQVATLAPPKRGSKRVPNDDRRYAVFDNDSEDDDTDAIADGAELDRDDHHPLQWGG